MNNNLITEAKHEPREIMNQILKYRMEQRLNKRQFCDRFGLLEGNYNRDFSGRDWSVIETETSDKLVEIKGEFIK